MDQTIQELKLKLKKIASAKEYSVTLKQQLDEYKTAIAKAEEKQRREDRDVEKLQKLSVRSILAGISGNKEEQLQKEEREALQAAMYLNQLKESERALRKEYVDAQLLIEQEPYFIRQLETAQHRALREQPLISDEIRKLHEAMEDNRMLDRELKEALDAGHHVYELIDGARERLGSAQSWGVYDMVGGGIISSVIKHERIDEAQQKISEIQLEVMRFKKEVEDVGNISLTNIDISASLSAFDIYFDNIISDVMVQSKISRTLNDVHDFARHIRELNDKLYMQYEENQKKYEEMSRSYHALLDQAA